MTRVNIHELSDARLASLYIYTVDTDHALWNLMVTEIAARAQEYGETVDAWVRCRT